MFKNMKFYFHPAKLTKTRLNIFTNQVVNHGGQVVKSSNEATHVIVEETCNEQSLPLSLWDNEVVVAGTQWMSQCIKQETVVDCQQFTVTKPTSKRKSSSPDRTVTKTPNQESQTNTSLTSDELKKFSCSVPSNRSGNVCNAEILSQLQKLADAYRARGDQWRVHGYEKAISAVRRYGKEITCYEDASSLEGVGAKMASKVMEIISTGSLRKAEELCGTEQSKVIDMFSNIWGAGPSAASAWYIKGHRSLDDLKEKDNLTKQQRIGIKYYNEFLKRMSRSEVEEIGNKVTLAALEVESTLTTVLCGSYRRGKSTCGDVDVVVIKPDRLNSKDILTAVLARLKETGFITDDLISLEKSGNQRKYLGVCKLAGSEHLHRRLDIFVVPRSESACAIMHYTGSALFNRSIRLLAAKKGMHLSEHSLAAGVVRQGMETLNGGYALATPTEEAIFEHLGLEYRPPEERDH